MPTSTLEYTRAAQERTIEALRQSQAAVVEAVGTWAKAVEKVAPQLPAVPVVEGLPTVDELIETSFNFTGQVLAAQREFAHNLVSAAAPAVKTAPAAKAAPAAKSASAA
jgi:hypothetical protein